MKKLLMTIIPLFLLVGCWRKRPQHSYKEEIIIQEERTNGKVKKLFIEEGEEIDTFSLTDDNSFDEQEPLIHLIDEPKETHWMAHRAGQEARYGLKTIYFDFDSDTLRPDQIRSLDANSNKINDLIQAGKTLIIEGHACKFGKSGQYNMMLSERRAQAVKKYLIKKGIPEKFLKTVGRGSEMCIVEQGSLEEQAPNRRVEFYIS